MIRTRDLVVFLVLLFVVACGIALTIIVQKQHTFFTFAHTLLGPAHDSPATFVADSTKESDNTVENIKRLQVLLANNDTTIIPSASVEDTSSTEQVSTPEVLDVSLGVVASIDQCDTYDDTGLTAASWPTENVSVLISGGNRLVTHATVQAINNLSVSTSSTDSVPTTEVVTLLTLKAYPVKQTYTSCVSGEVVGVTVQGELIHNYDAQLYATTHSEELLGYARDGFPIYGVYEGEVDACGGYQHSNGYRYTLTKERDVVLNCFFNTPSAFTL